MAGVPVFAGYGLKTGKRRKKLASKPTVFGFCQREFVKQAFAG